MKYSFANRDIKTTSYFTRFGYVIWNFSRRNEQIEWHSAKCLCLANGNRPACMERRAKKMDKTNTSNELPLFIRQFFFGTCRYFRLARAHAALFPCMQSSHVHISSPFSAIHDKTITPLYPLTSRSETDAILAVQGRCYFAWCKVDSRPAQPIHVRIRIPNERTGGEMWMPNLFQRKYQMQMELRSTQKDFVGAFLQRLQ